MLAPYSMDLDFFEQIRPECSSYPYYRCNTVFGLIGFLVVLMICEFACSVASISLSCKAYSKCCNTCNADDCCTCLGCCECDATPFNYHQVTQCFIPISLTVMAMIVAVFSVERILGYLIIKVQTCCLPSSGHRKANFPHKTIENRHVSAH